MTTEIIPIQVTAQNLDTAVDIFKMRANVQYVANSNTFIAIAADGVRVYVAANDAVQQALMSHIADTLHN